jgi:hypothetical protein
LDRGARSGRTGKLLHRTWQVLALRDDANPLHRIQFTSAAGVLRKRAISSPLLGMPRWEDHMASHIGWRKFITTVGGTALAWPLVARAAAELGDARRNWWRSHPTSSWPTPLLAPNRVGRARCRVNAFRGKWERICGRAPLLKRKEALARSPAARRVSSTTSTSRRRCGGVRSMGK